MAVPDFGNLLAEEFQSRRGEMMDDTRKKYRVWMCSVAGCFAQYDGNVNVVASDADEAIDRAFAELKRTAFPDRSRAMWKVEKVERVF